MLCQTVFGGAGQRLDGKISAVESAEELTGQLISDVRATKKEFDFF